MSEENDIVNKIREEGSPEKLRQLLAQTSGSAGNKQPVAAEKETQAEAVQKSGGSRSAYAERTAPKRHKAVQRRKGSSSAGNSRKKKTRKKGFKLLIIILIIAAVVIAAIFGFNAWGGSGKKKMTAAQEGIYENLTHLSFPQLSVTGQDGTLKVDEFKSILNQLYQEGYVLVDIYDLIIKDESGVFTLNPELLLEEGKKPLILSQRDPDYALEKQGSGYADKMVVDGTGAVKCEYKEQNQTVKTGDYDLVPMLEAFIGEHPDFSCNNARGILGVTGFNGILGYRTSSYLGESENNPYAEAYGTFDVESEKKQASKVVDALKAANWHFACYGYGYTSFGSEISILQQDMQSWMEEVSPLVGSTDLLIYPLETDIASRKAYSEDNEKYKYLKEQGFERFFINQKPDQKYLQIEDDYVRIGFCEIDNMTDFQNWLNENQSVNVSSESIEREE